MGLASADNDGIRMGILIDGSRVHGILRRDKGLLIKANVCLEKNDVQRRSLAKGKGTISDVRNFVLKRVKEAAMGHATAKAGAKAVRQGKANILGVRNCVHVAPVGRVALTAGANLTTAEGNLAAIIYLRLATSQAGRVCFAGHKATPAVHVRHGRRREGIFRTTNAPARFPSALAPESRRHVIGSCSAITSCGSLRRGLRRNALAIGG